MSCKGRQVLPAAWIEQATSRQILQSPEVSPEARERSDWLQGYGFQFWRSRHNAFRADGAFGQYIVVMPDQDAVVVITSETGNMQGVLDLVWEHLLPAMRDAKLAEDEAALARLRQHLAALALPVPARGLATPTADAVSGRTYGFDANEANLKRARFEFAADRCELTLEYESATYAIPFGAGAWLTAATARPGPNLAARARNHLVGLPPFQVAGAYGWSDPNTLELTLRYLESPHREVLRATFEGEKLTLAFAAPVVRPSPIQLRGNALTPPVQ